MKLSQSTAWPRRGTRDRNGSPSTRGSSFECSIEEEDAIHSWQSFPALGSRYRWEVFPKKLWTPGPLGLHSSTSRRGEGQSQYHGRPFQPASYPLKSGSLERTGLTPDQGPLSSWSGFRAGFGGPWRHTPSGILGGGREKVVVWALASGGGEKPEKE